MQARQDEVYEFCSFRLTTLGWRLEHRGEIIHLPKLDFLLLLAFLRQPQTILTKALLIPNVWPDEAAFSYHALQEHVHRLNKKLRVGTNGARCIHYITGQGYKFHCTVRRAA
jgi:DNA-binding winged helix-turn-helix (wHTH) protein